MAYRSEYDAIQAQCDTLRRQLKESEVGSEELKTTNEELKATLAKLGALRISEAERQVATGDLSRRAKLVGAAVALLVVVLVLTGVNVYVWQAKQSPVEAIVVDRTGLQNQTPRVGTVSVHRSPSVNTSPRSSSEPAPVCLARRHAEYRAAASGSLELASRLARQQVVAFSGQVC